MKANVTDHACCAGLSGATASAWRTFAMSYAGSHSPTSALVKLALALKVSGW